MIPKKMSGKPEKPDESECCGSGCKPCIFDVYEERLKKWKETNFKQSNVLDQLKYHPFVVVNVSRLTEFLIVFKFQAIKLNNVISNKVHIKDAILGTDYSIMGDCLNIKAGEYLILKGSYNDETISRSYTPVLNKDEFERGIFTIVISVLPQGKMSDFFTKVQTDEIVFWRGPYEEFALNPNLHRHFLLFGGGTGVVPMYNIAKTIVEDEESETWVTLMANFRSVKAIILREECRKLIDYWNFKMVTHVSEYSDFEGYFNERIIFNKMDETVIEREVKACGNDVFVVVSGPDGFNRFVDECCKKLEVKNIFIFW